MSRSGALPPSAVSSGAVAEFKTAGTTAAGATTVPLDRAFVPFIARQGKVAVGVGTASCEIREITGIAGTTLTLNTGLFNSHTADERIVFFEGTRVPVAWWGVRGNDNTIDSRPEMQAALRAIGKSQSGGGSPLTLDGQMKDIYTTGPVCVVQGTGIENFRLRAKTTGYVGPMDGPEHPTYYTNALCMLGQLVHRVTYSAATNTFTTTTASGAATTHGMGVGSRIVFDVGNLPSGLVAGRVYRTVVHPSTSTFQIAHRDTDPPLTFGSDGDGWVHVNLEDNVKLYARKVTFDGQNVGRVSVTAAAATDTFTSTVNHNLVDGDRVRLNTNGTMPGGVTAGDNVYYVRDSTPTTYKLAATSGGAAINITSDGAAFVINTRAALNGVIWGMQQPAFCEHVRVDSCVGFGIRVLTQQSTWVNLEIIGCGTNLEIGGEDPAQTGEFLWFFGLDTEQSDVRDVLIRTGKCIYIHGHHVEEGSPEPNVIYDVRHPVQALRIKGLWITASTNSTLFRFESGTLTQADYDIENLRGTFPAISGQCIAIDDRDRGVYLDIVDDFGGEGFAHYSTFATDTASVTDPHPYRWDGLNGAMEGWGSSKADLPFRVTRHGALKTSDITQWHTWTALTGTITLDVATDTFTTSVAHGLTEGQRIFVNTGSAVTVQGAAKWVNSTVYRARNVTATTFQLSHVPSGPIVDFVTGPATNWTIKYIGPVRQRLNKDARLVIGHNTPIADADLGNGEGSWYWDAAANAPVFKGKTAAGTPGTFTPLSSGVSTGVRAPAHKTGQYYCPLPFINTAAAAATLNQLQLLPIWVDASWTIDRAGVWVTVAGGTGAVMRFGLYAYGTDGYPGALLFDWGTAAATTAGAMAEVTVSQTIAPGIYWLAVAHQNGASNPTINKVSAMSFGVPVPTGNLNVTGAGPLISSGQSGVLPDPAPAGMAPSGSHAFPMVMLRTA